MKGHKKKFYQNYLLQLTWDMNLFQKQHKEMKSITSMLRTFPPILNLKETGKESAKLSMCSVFGNNLLPKQVVVINCCQNLGSCGNKMLQQILPEPV